MSVTPDELLSNALTDMPEGAYLTAAMVLVEYRLPGAEDEDDRGPYFAWRRDTHAGRWTHIGMARLLATDLENVEEDA